MNAAGRNMENNDQSEEQLQKLREKIESIQTGMLTTIDLHGRLRSRPMASVRMDELGSLWFFTNEFSGKVHEIIQNNHVNVAYANPGKSNYVSVTGEAEVITDKEKMKELWNPVMKAWFPGGLDDEKLSLLKVNITMAEYWDSSASGMVKLYHIAKAILKGEMYDEGKHGKLDIEKNDNDNSNNSK
jgi:general stress protein 26